jgi:hypothetical protein
VSLSLAGGDHHHFSVSVSVSVFHDRGEWGAPEKKTLSPRQISARNLHIHHELDTFFGYQLFLQTKDKV